MIELKDNTNIVFIGDSITSCGRNLYMELGFGFPAMVTSRLQAEFPQKNICAVSKGIGRNRSCDVLKRWNNDCLDLNPDVVVLYVGINDAIEQFFTGTMAQNYDEIRDNFDKMLSSLKEKHVIVIEPFININTTKWTNPWQVDETWVEALKPIRKIIGETAKKYNTEFIPLNNIFSDLAEKYGPDKWTCEGVHPTVAGHGIITKEILKIFGV